MIAYGRRPIEKVAGTRDKYHRIKTDKFGLYPGKHKAIISEELWKKAQKQRKKNQEKYNQKSLNGQTKIHLLSGLLKCPCCKQGMYSNKSIKKKDGKVINAYHYYYCKNQTGVTGMPCTFSKQINEQQLNEEIIQIISKLVADPEFAEKLKAQIKVSTDISTIEIELTALQKSKGTALRGKEDRK